MRLLVLDGSRVIYQMVRRLAPADVEVEYTASFDYAMDTLEHRAPDAVIVDVTPTRLPWDRFQRLCSDHDPPIPVLYESCVFDRPEDAGIGSLGEGSEFVAKPYHAAVLRAHIERLVGRVRHAGDEMPSRKGDDALH